MYHCVLPDIVCISQASIIMKPASVFVLIACVLLQVVHSMPVHQAEERALALVDGTLNKLPTVILRLISSAFLRSG